MKVDIRLYGIVGGPGHDDPAALAAAAVRGGATLIQYRDKHASTRDMIERATALKSALAPLDARLLINDRVDVALAVGADGVHLGQEDMPAETARRLLGPDAIIGLTIKNDRHVAEAPVDAIDYAAVGGVFATTSKDNPEPPVGLDGLARLANALKARRADLPVCAIAGINGTNAADVIAAGAGGVSVISAIFAGGETEARARRLRRIVDDALKAGRK
ncbi:MAG: thiamine phosphate synthase [Flavobacteriaceae bacterium]